MRDFKDLNIWKKSIEIVDEIYSITKDFPKSETYGLSQQLRRAAVSIASNISEGCGRRTSKDFAQFLYNAFGSVKEVECQLIIAEKLGYISEEAKENLIKKLDDTGRMLRGFIKHILEKGTR